MVCVCLPPSPSSSSSTFSTFHSPGRRCAPCIPAGAWSECLARSPACTAPPNTLKDQLQREPCSFSPRAGTLTSPPHFVVLCDFDKSQQKEKILQSPCVLNSDVIMLLLYFRPVTGKKTPPLRNHSICSGPRRFTFAFNYSACVFLFVEHPFPIGRLPGSRQSPGEIQHTPDWPRRHFHSQMSARGAALDWRPSGSPGTRGRDVWKKLLEIDVDFSFAVELKFK